MKILYVIRDMSFIEPLGIMFLSALAKQDGHSSSLGIINEEDVLEKVTREQPDVICMSVMSVASDLFPKLARDIKDRHPDVFIIVGGPQVTFECDAARRWCVDAAVQGEGDWAFRDLIRAIDTGEPWDAIPNVNTKTASNPMRRLVEPLDQLPHPDRELVYFPGGHLRDMNVKSFMSSRGCAYRCTYCFNSKFNELYSGNGTAVRRFSVDYMIEEIERVKTDYGLTFVRLGDDVFAYKVDDWLLQFAEQYRRRIGVPFYCLIRPNLLKGDLVRVLRKAGCHSISMSIEAGSERLRREVLLRKMTDEVITSAVKNVHDAGIHIYANAMVGLPNTSIADDIETVELAARCRVSYPSFTVFTPFRGTVLGEKCFKEGLIEGKYPEHTTDRSILNCFTEKGKNVQKNLVHLGIYAVRFPFLKRAILDHLIYLKPNPLFFFAWYLMKNYVSAKYIWPIQASIGTKIRLALRALSFELSGRFTLRSLAHKFNPRRLFPRVITDQRSAFTYPRSIFQDTALPS